MSRLYKKILFFLLPLIAAIVLVVYYSASQRDVCCDAYTYAVTASTMNSEGIWSQHDRVYIRTYLYPFLLSFNNKADLQDYKGFLSVYSNQTIVLLVITYTLVIALLRLAKTNKRHLIIFACLLNPLVLVYIPVTLTESYTVLLFACILGYLVWTATSMQSDFSLQNYISLWPVKVMILGVLSGLLVMLRPANIVITVASYLTIVLYSWFFSVSKYDQPKLETLTLFDRFKVVLTITVLFSVGFFLAAFPQIIINVKYFNKFSFFPFVDLAKSQYFWGLQNFKYGTLVRESASPLSYSTSGYLADISAYSDNPLAYYLEHPFSGLILLISHVYNSLNIDFLYTYINENDYAIISWYQLLSSFITITGLLGIVLMLRSFRGNFIFSPNNMFLLLCFIGFCILNAFIAVEVRFGMIPIISLTYFSLVFFVDHFKAMAARTRLITLFIVLLYTIFSAYMSFYFVSITGAFSTSWF